MDAKTSPKEELSSLIPSERRSPTPLKNGEAPSLAHILCALLFAHADPLPLKKLQEILEQPKSDLLEGIAQLKLQLEGTALQVLEVAGGFCLGTREEFSPYLKKLLKPPSFRLNPKTLETLAIIAYRQPVTRQEIESLRGVQVDGSLETLLRAKLVATAGRKDVPGRPYLYRTTEVFLKFFGLKSLKELPPLKLDLKGGSFAAGSLPEQAQACKERND